MKKLNIVMLSLALLQVTTFFHAGRKEEALLNQIKILHNLQERLIYQLIKKNNNNPLSSSCITRLPEDWSSDERPTTEGTFFTEDKKDSKAPCCGLEDIFCQRQKSRSASMPGIRTQPASRSTTRELAFVPDEIPINTITTSAVDTRTFSSSSFTTMPLYLTRSPSSDSIQSFATIPPNEFSSDNDKQSRGKSVIFL
jgi:hypothetical protein